MKKYYPVKSDTKVLNRAHKVILLATEAALVMKFEEKTE